MKLFFSPEVEWVSCYLMLPQKIKKDKKSNVHLNKFKAVTIAIEVDLLFAIAFA